MDHSLLVHVVDGFQHLADEVRCVLFRVRSLLDDPVKELTTRHSAYEKKEEEKKQV